MQKNHGGKRKGAGRKPKEPTITKRIPIGILDKVEALIKKHKAKPFHGFAEARWRLLIPNTFQLTIL